MDYEIFKTLRAHADPHAARQMSAYMKRLFPFLGIQTPERRTLTKSFLKQARKAEGVDWAFVFDCFAQDEREFQYLALDYLGDIKTRIPLPDIVRIEQLIQTKSWWDSVDSFDQVVGCMLLAYPELKDTHIRVWMNAENLWLRRVAINCQLSLKTLTDTELLADVILANLGSTEFFINKAIGWSLRDYSKTNRQWVAEFIAQHWQRMHPLSVREGSRNLQPRSSRAASQ